MKEKILVALKTKYSNLGFGAKALDGVASILEKSVTDESQIETAVSGMEDLNVRYDRLFASISGVSTGFPAAPTDLGVKNPPPIKSELK